MASSQRQAQPQRPARPRHQGQKGQPAHGQSSQPLQVTLQVHEALARAVPTPHLNSSQERQERQKRQGPSRAKEGV